MPTLTATVVPVAGPIAPGIYPQSLPCGGYDFAEDQTSIHVDFCVVSVVVKADTGNMEFNVTWALTFLAGRFASKGSDDGNPNMYVVDNLGQPYAHITTNGAAKLGAFFNNGKGPGPYIADGVFVFGPAEPGATVFAFHDDDQHIVIQNISLAGPPQ